MLGLLYCIAISFALLFEFMFSLNSNTGEGFIKMKRYHRARTFVGIFVFLSLMALLFSPVRNIPSIVLFVLILLCVVIRTGWYAYHWYGMCQTQCQIDRFIE